MTSSAPPDVLSPLEAALLDVRATLVELLAAADEQHAALVARDHERLESVTRQQESLSARLARAEARRLAVLDGVPLATMVASLPAEESARSIALSTSIAAAVTQLKGRHARTAGLLEQSIILTSQTIQFVQRLVGGELPAYDVRGLAPPTRSLLVDSRA
jgi:hypothetical protein